MNMKNAYTKPEIAVENFMLSEYIASCDPSFGNNMDVSIEDWINGFGLFTSDGECSMIVPPGQDIDLGGIKICYHTSSNVVFSS